jgi:hypothetical protein
MIRTRDRCQWWLVGGVWGVRRVVGRLLVVLAVAFPVTTALGAAADGATPNASGPAALHCGHWDDAMRISPGVGTTPANQSVTAHGKLWGCTKGGGGAQYSAMMHMSQATCGNLAMSGTASFAWVDGSHSTAWLVFHPQAVEPNKNYVSGSMTSGMFQGLVVSAWLRFTQVYTGTGAHCSPTNLLRHIDFTNSQSFQLLTPLVTTTTQPPGPPTSQPHPSTTPRTAPQTVPITNLGGPPTAPPTNAVPAFFHSGGGGGGPVVAAQQQPFPTGTLAFTGSRSGLAAMFGFEALLVGGALACLDPERRRRRLARFAQLRRRPKSFLQVTLPPMR